MKFKEYEYFLKKYNISKIYMVGSRVYKTNNKNSDYDWICITNNDISQDITIGNNDFHIYTEKDYIQEIKAHDILVLESLFYIVNSNEYVKYFELNKPLLRHIISQKANHSWVKAKKKITLEDEDTFIGYKSLYHSFRMIDFGIQLAKYNNINNFYVQREIYYDLVNNCLSWDDIMAKYKKKHNALMSEFRKLCPKG